LHVDGCEYRVDYDPGESTSAMFGGNSNWRGPIWFPLNYLLVEALKRYHHFYGDTLKVECPTGSGQWMNLHEVANDINARLARLFLPGPDQRRPCHGADERFARDPHWKDLLLFHEYFHGDDGRGLGASHQTGWTALVARCAEELAQARNVARNGRATSISPALPRGKSTVLARSKAPVLTRSKAPILARSKAPGYARSKPTTRIKIKGKARPAKRRGVALAKVAKLQKLPKSAAPKTSKPKSTRRIKAASR
jgi:hypothetical protein